VDIAARAAKLKARPGLECQCAKCGEPKKEMALAVTDAAQMYEEVDGIEAADAMAGLREWARCKGATAMTVSKGTQLQGELVSSKHVIKPDSTTMGLAEAEAGMTAALAMSYVTVGDLVYMQKSGAPIGGVQSTATAALALGIRETLWDADKAMRLEAGYQHDDMTSDEAVAKCRYVDDLVLASLVYCTQCLLDLPPHIYPPAIVFEPQASTEAGQPWTDLLLTAEGSKLTIEMLPVEPDWIENPACATPAKMRLPPYLGTAHIRAKRLSGLMSCKAARWQQVPLTQQGLVDAMANEVALWLRAGYPPSVQLQLWAKVAVNRQAVIRIKRLLRTVRESERSQEEPANHRLRDLLREVNQGP